jgi:ATP-dependent Zn protease
MQTRIPSVAYHEAGHAVAAFILGMHVDLVSIETQGFPPGWLLRGGVLATFNHEGTQNQDEAERAATAGLAGEQAERLWCRQKPWRRAKSTHHVNFSGDRAYVHEMLRPFIKDSADEDRIIKRLKEAARTLLANHWSCVEVLAAKLAEHKVLKSGEIKRLVTFASREDLA